MSDKNFRDPTSGFEVGYLVKSQITGVEQVIDSLHLFDNRWELLEFTCPVMGRLRVLNGKENAQLFLEAPETKQLNEEMKQFILSKGLMCEFLE